MKEYYDRARPSTTTGTSAAASSPSATGPAGTTSSPSCGDALAALPPTRTLDVACGTGFLTRHLPGEVIGLDQSARDARRSRASRRRTATFVQGDALALPFADGTFDRVFTGHFYGHLEERRARAASWPRRAGSRRELVVVDAASRAGRRARGAAGADPQRRLALGGLQALLRAASARRGARRRRDALRRPLVRRRPRLTRRRSSYRSLASLQRDNRVCRACAEAGYPLESLPIVAAVRRPARLRVRPGARDRRGRGAPPVARARGTDAAPLARARRGRRSTPPSTARPSRAATPGRRRRGRGDRTPTPREQELCAFWRDWELELIRPRADRHRRRPRGPPAARRDERHRDASASATSTTAPSRSRCRTRPERAAGSTTRRTATGSEPP